MTKPKLTAAQQRAVDWLPKDGGWRVSSERLRQALGSFKLYHGLLIDCEWSGSSFRWRLTPAGVAMFHPETDGVT